MESVGIVPLEEDIVLVFSVDIGVRGTLNQKF